MGPDGQPLTNDEWNAPWTKTLGMYLSGELHQVPGEPIPPTDDSFLFLLHASDDEIDFTLPGEPFGAAYEVVFDTGALRPPGPIPAGAALRLQPRSSALLRVAS
ncbi:MAG: glycogen debranching enzyme GlgX [Actinomycetota bacterium]